MKVIKIEIVIFVITVITRINGYFLKFKIITSQQDNLYTGETG